MQRSPKRIEICGGIATGKTTLARLLATDRPYGLVLERFRDNPFWARAYQEPDIFTPEKNLCFIPQHTGEIKASSSNSVVICDYAVFQDLVYASLCKATGHLATMQMVFEHLYSRLPPPTLMVHLKCRPTVLLRRIHERARKEEKTITLDYLASVNSAIERLLAKCHATTRVYELDSSTRDFAHDSNTAAKVKEEILSIVGESLVE